VVNTDHSGKIDPTCKAKGGKLTQKHSSKTRTSDLVETDRSRGGSTYITLWKNKFWKHCFTLK
jgi:hypothetical protein